MIENLSALEYDPLDLAFLRVLSSSENIEYFLILPFSQVVVQSRRLFTVKVRC